MGSFIVQGCYLARVQKADIQFLNACKIVALITLLGVSACLKLNRRISGVHPPSSSEHAGHFCHIGKLPLICQLIDSFYLGHVKHMTLLAS